MPSPAYRILLDEKLQGPEQFLEAVGNCSWGMELQEAEALADELVSRLSVLQQPLVRWSRRQFFLRVLRYGLVALITIVFVRGLFALFGDVALGDQELVGAAFLGIALGVFATRGLVESLSTMPRFQEPSIEWGSSGARVGGLQEERVLKAAVLILRERIEHRRRHAHNVARLEAERKERGDSTA